MSDADSLVRSIDLAKIDTEGVDLVIGGDYFLVSDPFTRLNLRVGVYNNGKPISISDANVFTFPVRMTNGQEMIAKAEVVNNWYRMDRTISRIIIHTASAIDSYNEDVKNAERRFAIKKGLNPLDYYCNPLLQSKNYGIIKSDADAHRYAMEPSTRRIKKIPTGTIGKWFLTRDPHEAMTRTSDVTSLEELEEISAESQTDAQEKNDETTAGFEEIPANEQNEDSKPKQEKNETCNEAGFEEIPANEQIQKEDSKPKQDNQKQKKVSDKKAKNNNSNDDSVIESLDQL